MPDACGMGESCLVVPDGWSGLVQLRVAEDGCERPMFQGASSYEGEWSCACACETTETSDCTDAPVTLELFNEADCSGVPAWTETLTQACQDFGYIDFYRVHAASELPVACNATSTVQGREILALGSQVGCQVPQGAACEGGTCQSTEAPSCVFADGDLPCPDGFPQRSVLFGGFDDGRACSECGCEATAPCGGQFVLHTDLDGCSEPSSVFFPFGTCSGSTSLVRGARIIEQEAEPSVQCETEAGVPMGEIEPTLPTTVCCAG